MEYLKVFVVITATITPANTDSVVLHPKLMIMINTEIIAKNETTANRVVGCFLFFIHIKFPSLSSITIHPLKSLEPLSFLLL